MMIRRRPLLDRHQPLRIYHSTMRFAGQISREPGKGIHRFNAGALFQEELPDLLVEGMRLFNKEQMTGAGDHK